VVLGVAAGAANLDVSVSRDGVRMRTGWRTPAATSADGRVAAAPPASTSPWRADLTALEQRLRNERRPEELAARRPGDDEAVMRRVRALIQESERTQRNELALRVAEVARDVQAQRAADLQRIQYSLGVIENTTGVAMRRQGQLLNSLAVRVSQRE
jgi:hypothetical protein